MPFFRQQGYDVALPDHPLFRALAAPEARLGDANEAELRSVFKTEVYRASDFAAGMHALDVPRERLVEVFRAFREFEKWGFVIFPSYEVLLTLYGPGGSFDAERGSVILFTTRDGRFKRKTGFEVVVHEFVHIGIQKRIVERLGLTHWEKERLVDRICAVRFRTVLPGYVVQGKPEEPLDAFVTEASLVDLPDAIEEYVRSKRGAAPEKQGSPPG
jgi:hypothetical protein